MEFTNQQKLIITLLTDIHAKLDIRDSVDPDFVRRAVCEDQGWALRWKYPGIFEESGENPADVEYVADVLEMWSTLEASFEELDLEGREALAAAVAPFGKNVKFPGFDGNHEHHLLAIARILVSDLDRWPEFTGRINNSHMQTVGIYKRMLEAFEDVRTSKIQDHDYGLFSVEEIAQVLKRRR